MKTETWDAARRKLVKAFKVAGVTTCEQCGNDNALSFAHTKKRRFIPQNSPLIYRVALLCMMRRDGSQGCHQRAEDMSHSDMEAIIESIIASREIPVKINL